MFSESATVPRVSGTLDTQRRRAAPPAAGTAHQPSVQATQRKAWPEAAMAPRSSQEAGVVQYSDSLVVDGKRQTMKLHGHLLRDHNNLFIPATWITDHREVIAYSGDGYDSLSWDLPDEWKDVTEVKAAVVGKHGLSEPTVLKVADGKVTLSLSPGEMVSLQPSETNK